MEIKTIHTFLAATALLVVCAFKPDKPCGETPELNKKIIAFVNSNLDKKVATGECWDVAAGALNSADAKWDGKYNFGKEVDYKKACIFPGDIIQFEGVELKYSVGDAIYFETLTHHTAIVYTVKDKGDYMIADQNTRMFGKKVATHAFDVKTVTKGKFTIYRPQK
jgi:hypothetical protein